MYIGHQMFTKKSAIYPIIRHLHNCHLQTNKQQLRYRIDAYDSAKSSPRKSDVYLKNSLNVDDRRTVEIIE